VHNLGSSPNYRRHSHLHGFGPTQSNVRRLNDSVSTVRAYHNRQSRIDRRLRHQHIRQEAVLRARIQTWQRGRSVRDIPVWSHLNTYRTCIGGINDGRRIVAVLVLDLLRWLPAELASGRLSITQAEEAGYADAGVGDALVLCQC